MLEDIYPIISCAVKQNTANKFLIKWGGDRNIRLTLGKAFFRVDNACTLETIKTTAAASNRELAFGGLIDEQSYRIHEFTLGQLGTVGECDWDQTLVNQLGEKAKSQGLKYFLGHTHPEGWGAVCSDSYWTKETLQVYTDAVSRRMLESGMYTKFGTDFLEMRVRQWEDPLLSSYFWIVAPFHNKAGLFKINKGKSIDTNENTTKYHPWKFNQERK